MSITELAVRRPTAVVAAVIVLLGLGAMGYFKLGADLFPAADTPVVSIHSEYPGAGSEEVEKDVVKPIEDAVSGLPGIDKIRSVSGEGFGYTIIQFTMATKSDTAVLDVQKAVDAMAESLPADAGRPVISKYDINAQPMMDLAIYGQLPYEELRAAADSLRKRLENLRGVGTVTLLGAPKRELDIVVDRIALESYGLGLGTVIGALRANNVTMPSGLMRQSGVNRPVRVVGEFSSVGEVGRLRIPLPRGGTVALSDLASVGFAYPRDESRARMDGRSAIGLLVVKTSDANIVDTANRIKADLAAESRMLPAGISLRVASDSTVFINSSLNETRRDLLLGILVTAVVLFLFLRKWRSSLIVLVAIPTSLVSTFFMMYLCGFTLNIVSVMALALCIGILVDDSIVVLENIHRHRQLGEEPTAAAIRGRSEIAMAAIAITSCDVVVFAPVAFMGDIVGQFFRQFGLTVVFASLFSLFVSFTLTPAMAARLLERESADGPAERPGRFAAFFDSRVKGGYRRTLLWSLRHRAAVLAAVAALVAASLSLLPLGAVQTEFMPAFDQGKLDIDVNLGAGADMGRTEAAAKTIEARLLSLPEVRDVFSRIGTSMGPNLAEITVRLKDKSQRRTSQSQLARELRSWVASLPGAEISVREEAVTAQTSIEGNKPFILNITGPDRSALSSLAARAEALLRATPGAVDVQNSDRSRQTEINVAVDRLALSECGLSAADVAGALRTAFAGTEAGVFRSAGEEYDMVVKFSPDQTKTPLDLAAIRLTGAYGGLVPIGQVARITRGDAPSSLERSMRSNVVTLMCDLQGRPLGAVSRDVEAGMKGIPFPPGYAYQLSGDTSMMSGSFRSLAWALAASIALVYLVLVVLYESYLTPFIRLLSLPAGIIGGLAAMALAGKTINIISFIGIIMLDGLASKNGTLLIDYTNTLLKRGLPLADALVEAGSTRLRPILMTSATMIVGMLPLALSSGSSSEIKSGMAVVLIGGLVTSTLISPILLPVVYTLIAEARERRRTGRSGGRAPCADDRAAARSHDPTEEPT
ncbi:MAG TPA: efflux RND transporter permease subunit [Rectinemataceae bacterium]|nr:efflux RND transporter permease subunit [Rectinemataceae bacterium]